MRGFDPQAGLGKLTRKYHWFGRAGHEVTKQHSEEVISNLQKPYMQ